jgi:hypothetical protein
VVRCDRPRSSRWVFRAGLTESPTVLQLSLNSDDHESDLGATFGSLPFVSAQQFRQLHLQIKALHRFAMIQFDCSSPKSRSRPLRAPHSASQVGTTFTHRYIESLAPTRSQDPGANQLLNFPSSAATRYPPRHEQTTTISTRRSAWGHCFDASSRKSCPPPGAGGERCRSTFRRRSAAFAL